MGKLNYTNRKISGIKLGSAVKKDVLKHSQSASKSKSAKDPHLEVYLQGKSFCDEGLEIACDGLCQALSSGLVRLDELHLAENKITVSGLKFLGDVVRLAGKDLKDLDLRANALAISTKEDADNWERFLESFRDVSCLRKLDISDNAIGDRGFEILWKVYSREQPIHLPRLPKSSLSDNSDNGYDTDGLGGDDSDGLDGAYDQTHTMSLHSNTEYMPAALTTPTKLDSDSPLSKSSLRSSTSHASTAVELHGLRSIPYMIISQTGVTDNTALFLSYILPLHPTPERLMPYIPAPKPGCQADTLESYYALNCRGIVYRPNDRLSPLSNRVLECAEAMREGKPVKITPPEISPNRTGNKWTESPYSPRKKESPFTLGGSAPPASFPALERARSKIQGALLRDNGPHCIALWSSALRMLVISREILFDPNAGPYECSRRSYGRPTAGFHFPISTSQLSSPGQDRGHSPPNSPTRRFSMPGGFLPLTSPRQLPHSRFDTALDRMDSLALDPNSIPEEMDSEAKKTKVALISAEPKLPGGLPRNIWRRIIAMAADPEGALSSKQVSNLMDWAKTRDTLEKERELAGKLRSLQIWRILEATECLAYERSS